MRGTSDQPEEGDETIEVGELCTHLPVPLPCYRDQMITDRVHLYAQGRGRGWRGIALEDDGNVGVADVSRPVVIAIDDVGRNACALQGQQKCVSQQPGPEADLDRGGRVVRSGKHVPMIPDDCQAVILKMDDDLLTRRL